MGAKVDYKMKVSAYYEIEFSELLSVLKKNKRKLRVDPSLRTFTEDLRREFSASMEKLSPLLLRIGEVVSRGSIEEGDLGFQSQSPSLT